jgi:hypothetical protein
MAFVGSDLSGHHRFQEMMLDERRSFELARDGMLSLLVNIVRNREDGLMAPARAEQALEHWAYASPDTCRTGGRRLTPLPMSVDTATVRHIANLRACR